MNRSEDFREAVQRALSADMKPKLWGIPALGAFGYVFAFIIVLYVFLKHFFSRK